MRKETHTLTHSHTQTHTTTLTHSHTNTHNYSHTQTHTTTHTQTHTTTLTHKHTQLLSHTPHNYNKTHKLILLLQHKHTNTITITHTHTHTHIHTRTGLWSKFAMQQNASKSVTFRRNIAATYDIPCTYIYMHNENASKSEIYMYIQEERKMSTAPN